MIPKKRLGITWPTGALGFAISSSIFFALVTVMDNIIVKNFIVLPNNPLFAVFIYLILGSWMGLLVQLITSNIFGKLIDKTFISIKFFPLKEHREVMFSGLLSAAATMFSLWGSQLADPSVVLVLLNIVLVYLVIYDVFFTKTLSLKDVILPAALVILGSILASLRDLQFTFQGIGLALVVLLLGRGLTSSFSKLFDQQGARKGIMDSVNFAFWRFFWLAVFGSVLAVGWSIFSGNLNSLFPTLVEFAPIAFFPILVLMVFVTFGNATEISARKLAAMSIVSLLITFQVVVIIPITLLINYVSPNIFGSLPTDPLVWVARILGAALVVGGVLSLRKIENEAGA